jgi:hypothetical protein
MNDIKIELKDLIAPTETVSEVGISLDAFRAGYILGISRYAHWSSGVQYVGTTGRTLKEAIEEISVIVDEVKLEEKLT